MGIFTLTLTQAQAGKNLYLYPNGDLSTCTEFAAVGDIPNYACVDENHLTPDDDSTYVWWNGAATGLDLYEVQNHTTEVGPINYIQVYARGKSNKVPQHINGIYKIVCSPDSTCSHVYKSDNIDITTNYSNYNKVWVENPQTEAAWTWDNIDALSIGIECNSPSLGIIAQTLTLRPTGVGNYAQHTTFPATDANWECVDEVIPNDATDNVRSASESVPVTEIDSYTTENHTTEVGAITKVVMYFRGRSTTWPGINHMAPMIRLSGTDEFGTYVELPQTPWTTYAEDFATKPGGGPWTWADIDNMEIGIRSYKNYTYTMLFCTQVYAIVHYNESINPKVHTTQCYVKVNYDTTATCNLQSPDWIGTNHSRNVKTLNFWNGTREVYDLNRSGKSMVLTGTEAFSGACAKIVCARNIARNGSTVVITGFSLEYFNGSYKIRSFGWNKISEKPEHYKWIMELEDTEL